MKLKLDDAGHVVVRNDKPVYVTDQGQEIEGDLPAAVQKIKNVSDERDGYRTKAEQAEGKLKLYGDLDPAKAKEAIEKVADLSRGKLIEAGKVEEVRTELQKQFDAQIKVKDDAIAKVEGRVRQLTVGAKFRESAFFTSRDGKDPRTFYHPGAAEKIYGEHFEVAEDGRIVAKVNGKELMSPTRFGEPADFDEAISILIEQDPNKNTILRATGGSGAGALGGATANGSGAGSRSKTITRAQLDTLSPADRSAHFKAGGTVVDGA